MRIYAVMLKRKTGRATWRIARSGKGKLALYDLKKGARSEMEVYMTNADYDSTVKLFNLDEIEEL